MVDFGETHVCELPSPTTLPITPPTSMSFADVNRSTETETTAKSTPLDVIHAPTPGWSFSPHSTGSHLLPPQTQETHDAALQATRAFLKGRMSYNAFPVSFRVIVLDLELEVKKALQCLLTNGAFAFLLLWPWGPVEASPLS